MSVSRAATLSIRVESKDEEMSPEIISKKRSKLIVGITRRCTDWWEETTAGIFTMSILTKCVTMHPSLTCITLLTAEYLMAPSSLGIAAILCRSCITLNIHLPGADEVFLAVFLLHFVCRISSGLTT